jgi:undecaprenyl diphosphate synthase
VTRAVPRHVAIVMDGNGRWARKRLLPRAAGHRAGANAVRAAVRHAAATGIRHLTLFAFSSENWRRPADEVGALMRLFLDLLDAEVDELNASGVRLSFIGERTDLAAGLRERMASAEARTAANSRLELIVAIGYGGRWDIVAAARRFATEAAGGRFDPATLDEQCFAAGLALGTRPDPDLFIRTGGEQRISNFLLWNLAYAELYFTPTLWPDFDDAEFDRALGHYAARERRYGMTSEQVR